MKLGSLKEGGRDGTLIVVSVIFPARCALPALPRRCKQALDDWSNAAPRLNALSDALDAGRADGDFELDFHQMAAHCRELTNSWTAAPICRTWNACGARATLKCPRALYRSADVPGDQRRLLRTARSGAGEQRRLRYRSGAEIVVITTMCRWR